MKSKVLLCLSLLYAGLCTAQHVPSDLDRGWIYMNIDSLYKAATGTKYMPFEVTTLDGKKFNNANCKGKVTFVNFWFEGCGPCRGEFGKLNELYDSIQHISGCQLVAVTFDDTATLPDFIQKFNLRYPIATVGDQRESKRLDYNMGYPNSIILDKQGKIAYIGMKAIGDVEEAYKVPLKKLLGIMHECSKKK